MDYTMSDISGSFENDSEVDEIVVEGMRQPPKQRPPQHPLLHRLQQPNNYRSEPALVDLTSDDENNEDEIIDIETDIESDADPDAKDDIAQVSEDDDDIQTSSSYNERASMPNVVNEDDDEDEDDDIAYEDDDIAYEDDDVRYESNGPSFSNRAFVDPVLRQHHEHSNASPVINRAFVDPTIRQHNETSSESAVPSEGPRQSPSLPTKPDQISVSSSQSSSSTSPSSSSSAASSSGSSATNAATANPSQSGRTTPNLEARDSTPQPISPDSADQTPNKRALLLKERGNARFNQLHYDEALELYTQALNCIQASDDIDKDTAAKLHFNLAMAHSKLGANKAALKECINAVKLDPGYLKAHMKRAEIHSHMGEYNEAQIVYEYLNELNRENREWARLLEHNANLSKRGKKRDYYEILGVHKFSSEAEIKKSYRTHALKHHPDRHSDADEVSRRIEEKRFKEASEAYKVLSDPKQRQTYDLSFSSPQCSYQNMHSNMRARANAAQTKARWFGAYPSSHQSPSGGPTPTFHYHQQHQQHQHHQHQNYYNSQDFASFFENDPFIKAFKNSTGRANRS